MPSDCLRYQRRTRPDSPNQIPSQQWYLPTPNQLLSQPRASAHSLSRPLAPFQVTSADLHCPCQTSVGRGPRELPENILSGVMFNLDSSATPNRGGLPCWQKGHPQSNCPTSIQTSQLAPCKVNLGLVFSPKSVGEVVHPASPVHRSRWVRRPEVDLRPILQSSHRRERAGNTLHPQGLRAMIFGSGRGGFLFLR